MAISDSDAEKIGIAVARAMKSLEGVGRSSYIPGTRQRSRDDSTDTRASQNKLAEFGKKFGEETKTLYDAFKVFHKHVAGMSTHSKKYQESLKDLAEIIDDLGGSLETLDEHTDLASENVWKFASNLDSNNEVSKHFGSGLAKSIVKVGVFNTALLAQSKSLDENTHLYDSVTKNLKGAAGKLDKNILRAAGVFDEITGTLKQNIRSSDFQNLNLRVSEMAATIQDAISKIGVDDLSKLSASDFTSSKLNADNSSVKPALDEAITKLTEMGVDFSDIFTEGKSESVAYFQAMKRINELQGQNMHVMEEFNSVARSAGTGLGQLTMKLKHASAAYKDWVDANVKSAEAILDNASKFGSAMVRILDQALDFNMSMLPDTFANVQANAIKMGVSFEKLNEVLKESNMRRMYAMYGGAEEFNSMLEGANQTLRDRGYSADQALEMTAAAVPVAAQSFVDMRDAGKLNQFINESAAQFEKLASITGMSVEEFAALNSTIYSSDVMQSRMIGLNDEQTEQLRASTAAQLQNYKSLGLSNEAATEAILISQREKRMGAAARVKGAAAAMMLAQQSGMNKEDVSRMQQLEFKRVRTTEEDEELDKLRAKTREGLETRQAQLEETAKENTPEGRAAAAQLEGFITQKDSLVGMLDENRNEKIMGNIATETIRAQQNGQALTPEEVAAQQAAAKPDETIGELGTWARRFQALMDNSLVAAATSASLALWGLAASAAANMGVGGLRNRGENNGNQQNGRRARPRTGPGSAADVRERRQMGREGRVNAGVNTNGPGGRGVNAPPARPARPAAKPGIGGKFGGIGGTIALLGGGLALEQLASSGAISEDQTAMANQALDLTGSAMNIAGVARMGPAGMVAASGMAGWETGKLLNQAMEGTAVGSAKDSMFDSIFSGVDALTGGAISGNEEVASQNWKNSSLGKFFGAGDEESTASIPMPAMPITPSMPSFTTPGQTDQPGDQLSVNNVAAEQRRELEELRARVQGPQGALVSSTSSTPPAEAMTPEKMSETMAKALTDALGGVRLTMYNPNAATTSHAYITGRQPA